MSFRRSAVVAGTLVALTATASAVIPRPPLATRPAAEHLTAMPSANLGKPLRTAIGMRYRPQSTPAWTAFRAQAGGRWNASWDRATGVPSRIWGSGIATPGVISSAPTAEQTARRLLADHLALLAPGASASDFVLASNHLANGVRSVGFVQRAGGVAVVGGQVSFRFKRDRLVAIGSEALPNVTYAKPRARLARAALASRVTPSLRTALAMPTAPVSAAGDEVVLPLVGDDAVLAYRLARPITIDGGVDGRYLGYADAATGELLAVKQMNAYATGTLLYKTVDRHPGNARVDRPAARTHVTIAGATVTTTMSGGVSWSPDTPQTLTTAVTGDLVKVVNKVGTEALPAIAELSIAPDGAAVWDASATEHDDAQINVFIATNIVKDFVARELDPDMPLVSMQLIANVNIGQECNAFWDGKTINFLQSSDKCQNTGLVTDVVFHEFGHALHQNQIIAGVGAFDGAMSEGASDFLAAIISNDSGMGRGFRYSDNPLREIDPPDKEYRWPEDVKEIHYTGQIYAGALWDLRKDLAATLGEAEGNRIVNKLFVATLRRATNIPSSLIEVLVEDDDDGDLENGTPNECAIRSAFGAHGLRTVAGTIIAPGALDNRALSTLVKVDVTGLSTRCGSDEIESVTVDWRPSNQPTPAAGSDLATESAPGHFWVQLPLAIDGKVLYRARVKFTDGSNFTLADNLADPYYELYQGETIPLYCTDFENENPFQNGWITGAGDNTTSIWEWGPNRGGATDPPVAYSGTRMLGQNLGGDYEPATTTWIKMPSIDVGRWTDVHLQYRRWLAVEDSHFDKAKIAVNGKQVWTNFTADDGDGSATHHIDREWRFHDVLLSGWSPSRNLQVSWELTSDMGLHLGGWQLDDVCIVANVNSVCGDGVRTPTEGCDLGPANSDKPDSECRTFCLKATCGDGILDSDEECDHGPGDNRCSAQCTDIDLPTLGGCCSTGGGSGGSLALGALVAGLVLRRRRRR
ncbi:MAG: MYXO-CTERM sorting domain-containing protein [Kofleriaceae bacterium]